MYRIILFAFLSVYALTTFAVPAKRERHRLTLANGSTVEATWTGDETMHFYLTDDGRCLQCDNDGIARFVDADNLHKQWEAKIRKRQDVRARRRALRQRKAQRAMTGSKPGLVILVQFPDVPFHYTNADFQRFFNEKGYKDQTNIGSVRD